MWWGELAPRLHCATVGIDCRIAVLGEEGMAYFRKLRDFESRFDTRSVDELKLLYD